VLCRVVRDAALLTVEPAAALVARVDPGQLEQALVNLVSTPETPRRPVGGSRSRCAVCA
jgi:hypothetical protein